MTRGRRGSAPSEALYEAADFVVVRAPLLPLEDYHALPADSALDASPPEHVRQALAVGSLTFFDALQPPPGYKARPRRADSTLLRYLIRMSTRPTPFGLFAGVGLGRWGDTTDLELSAAPRRRRTRPDMAWLMAVVLTAESDVEIRRHLSLVANRSAVVRAGRVFLAERASRGEVPTPPAVSIRATGVVLRALEAARQPVPYTQLARLLLDSTPAATPEKVEALLTGLWEQTLLLTDLRPPLTVESPGRYVVDRLQAIPAAAGLRDRLQSVMDAAAAFDESPEEDGVRRYRTVVAKAAETASFERAPVQVDSALSLTGRTVSHLVGREAARAAEILLRLSPLPHGPGHLAAYRRQFERRYGMHREVPLLELLDPAVGLGPPVAHPDAGVSQATSVRRNRALLDLALTAYRDRALHVELDEPMLSQLETWVPTAAAAPTSLDLYVCVAAASREALDAGEFQLAVGPNVGGLAAGRTLGRFADLLPEAEEALAGLAKSEEAQEPDALWAELAYQPRRFRLANVSTRPNVRSYEVAVGVTAGTDPAHTVSPDALVAGVRSGRFYIRWPAAGRDVTVTAGHMLTPLRAPALCRFLSEIGRDGRCQLSGWQWGVASGLPFLPRVQVGRIVLAPAQWRLTTRSVDPFREGLDRWREHWQVPRHVYLTAGDNRLLLDLSAPAQAAELRHALSSAPGDGTVVVTEVFPDLDQAWVRDTAGRHYVTELVVPLVRTEAPPAAPAGRASSDAAPTIVRLRPPGSDWIFAKLYGGRDGEDELLGQEVRRFVGEAMAAGLVDRWFFIRYDDEGRHLRLRFHGQPTPLWTDLLPRLCAWAGELMTEGMCRRFVLDTYERELERFGGAEGTEAAEVLFCADSQAALDLLDLQQTNALTLSGLPLAVLTVDALLDGLGLDVEARARWCRHHLPAGRETSGEYREWTRTLRPLLFGGAGGHLESGGAELDDILGQLRVAGAATRAALEELDGRGRLTRPPSELHQSFVHLHCNRLLGADRSLEGRVLAVLWRLRAGLARSDGGIA